MPSRLSIKNMALDEMPTDRIDVEGDGSLADEKLATIYPEALAGLLEAHDWDFCVTRAALAQVTNDRGHEWRYAYALPADLAKPLRLMPFRATDQVPAWPSYAAFGAMRGLEGAVPYRISGSLLYANQEAAVLEYGSSQPSEARFSAKFARALALEVAVRGVMPLTKDAKRQRELMGMAELARERAKAEDMNRDRESPRDFVSETELARAGLLQ